jgi:prepilin-type N-terminal cleavage/methylation domain-containing protein
MKPSGLRSAFTLLEVLVALMLIAAIAAGGFSLFRGAVAAKERLAADSRRALEVATLESVLRQAVLSSEAGSNAGDFAVSSQSMSIPCRVLRLSQGADRRGPYARRFSLFVDDERGTLLAAWDDEPAAAILEGVSSASFRVFDGRTWLEDFSAARDGGLPLAVEISLRWRPKTASPRVAAAAPPDASEVVEGPADVIIAVAVPDAAPEVEGGSGGAP